MNVKMWVIIVVATVIVSACGFHQVPAPVDSGKGLIALPIESINSTQVSGGFAFYYQLRCSLHPEANITIHPGSTRNFAFSSELPPGKYSYGQIKIIHKGMDTTTDKNASIRTFNRPIILDVERGKITVFNGVFKFTQRPTDPHQFVTSYKINALTKVERNKKLNDLYSYENIEKWQIAE